jgi:hypothetical protein
MPSAISLLEGIDAAMGLPSGLNEHPSQHN